MIRPSLRGLVKKCGKVAPRSPRRKPLRRRAIRLEALEDRCLLAVGVGADQAGDSAWVAAENHQEASIINDALPVATASLPKWTFMLYSSGDSNLENEAIRDFLQLAAVGSTMEVNIVVQLDRGPGCNDDYDGWEGTRRGMVLQGDVPNSRWGEPVGVGGEANMGAPATLAGFLTWAKGMFPAEHYALVFFGHAGGVNDGICYDDSSNNTDGLQTNELTAAFGVGQYVDLIGIDGCWAAGVEIADEIRPFADVLVASEAKEPGGWGWDRGYREILTRLTEDPDMSATTFALNITNVYAAHHSSFSWATISAVDLRSVGSLVTSLDLFADTMLQTATPSEWERVLKAHERAKHYEGRDDLHDIGDWMWQIIEDQAASDLLVDSAAAVVESLTACVIVSSSSSSPPRHDFGLSVYAPFAKLHRRYDPRQEGNLIHFVAATRWEEFVGPRGIDLVEVIDRSGSMWGEKLAAAKEAAKEFIDLMYPYDKLGVVGYSKKASIARPLARLAEEKEQAKAAVDSLTAYGSTSIGDGVSKANLQLMINPTGRLRAMLVMSDGIQTEDPEPITVINTEVDRDVVIYTIGFGQDAQDSLLTQMASMRHGQYYHAPGPDDLSRVYFRLSSLLAGTQFGPSSSRTIQANEEVRHNILVDRMTAEAVFAVNALGSDVDLTLVAPDGTLIDPSTPASNPCVAYERGGAYRIYTVQLPMVGHWQMVARGTVVPAQGATVNLYASLDSPVRLAVSTDKLSYNTGEVVHVQAELRDIGPIPGASVAATISAPLGSSLAGSQLVLYDDGAHGDGAADDGLYANDTAPLDVTGSYTLSVDAQGQSYWGDRFARNDFLSVSLMAAASQRIAGVTVVPANGNANMQVGQQRTFSAIAQDEDGKPAIIAGLVWEVYDPAWETRGGGTLQQNGATCTFTATQAGRWEIACYDASNPGVRGTATVMITGVGLRDGRLQIVGSQGNDTVTVNRLGANGLLVYTSFLSGSKRVQPFLSGGITEITVYGGAGRDTISVASNVSTLAWLYGGEGDDVLSGGRGSDVLVGGPGRDTLRGGPGRNMLIGGDGADSIFASTGDNLAIAGSTTYDDDQAALAAILAEWSRTDASYAARLGHLNGTLPDGLNRNRDCLLNGDTLRDDAARDLLFGGLGQNWYHARRSGVGRDFIFGMKRSEVVNFV